MDAAIPMNELRNYQHTNNIRQSNELQHHHLLANVIKNEENADGSVDADYNENDDYIVEHEIRQKQDTNDNFSRRNIANVAEDLSVSASNN